MYHYRTVDTSTPEGLRLAEWYKAHGWTIVSVGFSTIQFQKKAPKYRTVFVVQQHTGGYGWEDVYEGSGAKPHRDARERMKEYYQNQPGIPVRLITRRVLNNPEEGEP